MASVGSRKRGTTSSISPSFFGDAGAMEVGEQWVLSGDCLTVDGTQHILELRDGVPKEGRVDLPALWTFAVKRSTS